MALSGKRALFLSYNGMLDPLGQSQVIPYLRELGLLGVRFTLLSFERQRESRDQQRIECESLRRVLLEHNIEWHWLPYHHTPSLPATIYDVMSGVRHAQKLVKRNQIELIHARGYIPATIAVLLKKRLRPKLIFDMRGLMAEEYADAGHWREGSVAYRLTKSLERRAFAASDAVVTLTEAIWPIIKEWDGLRGRNVAHAVVPCCADLERFRFDASSRAIRRAELNVKEKFVVVYSGSIGSWYMAKEMADFFATLLARNSDAHFLWLTRNSHKIIKDLMHHRKIDGGHYSVRAVSPPDIASYLSASDVGLAFIKPCFSKMASSPTKTAEYLACGLPIIINQGIGDSDALITRENLGALVRDFTSEDYSRAAATATRMVSEKDITRRRSREAAERLFNLKGVGRERYRRLYEDLIGQKGSGLPA